MDIAKDPQLDESKGMDARLEERPGQDDQTKKREILQNYRQLLAKDPRNVTLLNEVGLAAEAAGDGARFLRAATAGLAAVNSTSKSSTCVSNGFLISDCPSIVRWV